MKNNKSGAPINTYIVYVEKKTIIYNPNQKHNNIKCQRIFLSSFIIPLT